MTRSEIQSKISSLKYLRNRMQQEYIRLNAKLHYGGIERDSLAWIDIQNKMSAINVSLDNSILEMYNLNEELKNTYENLSS